MLAVTSRELTWFLPALDPHPRTQPHVGPLQARTRDRNRQAAVDRLNAISNSIRTISLSGASVVVRATPDTQVEHRP